MLAEVIYQGSEIAHCPKQPMQKHQRFSAAFLYISELILLFDFVLHGSKFCACLPTGELSLVAKIVDLAQKISSFLYKKAEAGKYDRKGVEKCLLLPRNFFAIQCNVIALPKYI